MEGVNFSEDVAFRYQAPKSDARFASRRDVTQTVARQPELVKKQLALLSDELEAHTSSGPVTKKIGFDVLEDDLSEVTLRAHYPAIKRGNLMHVLGHGEARGERDESNWWRR